MTLMQGRSISGLAGKKARYPAFVAIGLFFLFQIFAHDVAIHFEIETSGTSINAVSQLFFPTLSHDFVALLGQITFGLMLAMIGLAIAIRVAQYRAKHR